MKMIPTMRNGVLLALAVMGLALASGCGLTMEMWDHHGSRYAYFPRVAGIARCPSQTETNETLLISYHLPTGNVVDRQKEFFVPIQLDAERRAAAPFRHVGPERSLRSITDAVESDRLDRLPEFISRDIAAGRRLVHSENFVPANTAGPGVWTHIGMDVGTRGSAIVVYWGGIATYPVDDNFTDPRFPRSSEVLLLPGTLRRPTGEYSLSIASAVVKTPFYLIADVFFTPYFFFCMSMGPRVRMEDMPGWTDEPRDAEQAPRPVPSKAAVDGGL